MASMHGAPQRLIGQYFDLADTTNRNEKDRSGSFQTKLYFDSEATEISMTLFGYIAVVISLVYAFAVADVLRALIPAATPPARYWPHFAWLLATVLVIAYTWWAYWNTRTVSWTGLLFVYALINPSLLTVQVRLLTSKDPYSVPSFRDHFHAVRRPFFAIFLVTCLNGFCTAWIFGSVPLWAIAPVQIASLPGALLAITGFFFRSDRACGIIVILALLLILTALALHPIFQASAAAS